MDFAKIRPRGGTKAQWEKANPVLAKREIGVQWETTIGVGEVVIKIGDGVTDWINLPEAVKCQMMILILLMVIPLIHCSEKLQRNLNTLKIINWISLHVMMVQILLPQNSFRQLMHLEGLMQKQIRMRPISRP